MKTILRRRSGVGPIQKKSREGRIRWYGHVVRRDTSHIGRNASDLKGPSKSLRGKPKTDIDTRNLTEIYL